MNEVPSKTPTGGPSSWAFSDEGIHPGAAIEWWFIHGVVGELEPSHFMVSLFRHKLEADGICSDHGHASLLTILDPGSERHRAVSLVDDAVVRAVAARPQLSAVSNVDRRFLDAFFEEICRHGPPRGVSKAGRAPTVRNAPLRVEWDDMRIEQHAAHIRLSFVEPGDGRPWDLALEPIGPRLEVVPARRAGKPGHGMEMVTYPRLVVSGDVGGSPVAGSAWLDHQWGGRGWFFADGDAGRALGWEWFGANLDDGRNLLVMVHRDAQSGAVVYDHASIAAGSTVEHCTNGLDLEPIRFWESPRTLISYPVEWRMRIPSLGVDLRFEPLADDQEVPVFGMARAIWEGAGRVSGTVGERPAAGSARGEVYGRGFVFDFADHLESMRMRIDSRIEEFLPPVLEDDHLQGFIGRPSWQYEPAAYRQMLTDPVWDLVSRRGKRWRPLFGLLMLNVLGCDPAPYEELVSVLAELLHTGALIIDDIQDRSLLRRGDECIHLRHGNDVAISAANTLYFLPSILVSRHPLLNQARRLALHETTVEQLLSAHLGQALDLYWSRNMNADNLRAWMSDSLEPKILQMYAQKTASPLVALVKIASALTEPDEVTARACIEFAQDLGVAYQIVDDIRNFSAAPEWRKACGEDLAEGKMTLVVLWALQRLSEGDHDRLQEIICSPELRRSPDGQAEGIELVRRSGALDACRTRAMEIVEPSWREASEHLASSESKIVLRALWGALLDDELRP